MFDLLDRPLHWIAVSWPALVSKNAAKLAEPGEHEVELRVELIDREEAIWRFPAFFDLGTLQDERRAEIEKRGPPPDSFDTFKRVASDWRKIQSNGQKVEMNDDNIRLLLAAPMFEAAFAVAYISALGGRAMVREGNSAASPSGGRGAKKRAATNSSPEIASGSA